MSNLRDIANETAKQRSAVTKKAKQVEAQKSIPSRVYRSVIMGAGNVIGHNYNKKQLIEQVYERNPAFFAAVNILAQTVAAMPVYVKSRHGQTTQRSDNHPALSLLERNTTKKELVEMTVKYLLSTGESFSNLVCTGDSSGEYPKRKRPLGFVLMPSQHVDIVEGDWRQPIAKYRYTQHTVEEFDPNEVAHVRFPSLSRNFQSMSPALPLASTIDLNNAAITWNKNTALSGGMPPVVARLIGADKSELLEFKEGWAEQRGANAQHEMTAVSGEVEFEKFAVNPHDAEWEQAILQSMRIILMTLNISSSLMNDAGNKTYNNIKDARKGLYTEGAIPLAEKVYDAFTKVVKPYYDDRPEYCIDTSKIDAIQEDKKAKVERIVAAINGGVITENEGRLELGYSPSDDPRADRLINVSLDNNTGAQENRDSVKPGNPNLPDESL